MVVRTYGMAESSLKFLVDCLSNMITNSLNSVCENDRLNIMSLMMEA